MSLAEKGMTLIHQKVYLYKMKISMASMIFEFWVETGELKVKHNALNGRNLNKNYYLVRNAGCARSRYTLK